jgi:hypothetical protein
LIVITPSTDHRWVAALRGLRARGVNGVAVLLAGRTFGPAPDWEPVLADLRASGLTTYLVKRDDDLSDALTRPENGTDDPKTDWGAHGRSTYPEGAARILLLLLFPPVAFSHRLGTPNSDPARPEQEPPPAIPNAQTID